MSTANIAVISGKKVREDDITRWFVFCYVCRDGVSESVLDANSLRAELEEHIRFHQNEQSTNQ